MKFPMSQYLGEKIRISDTDTDVYRCEVYFIYVFTLAPILPMSEVQIGLTLSSTKIRYTQNDSDFIF